MEGLKSDRQPAELRLHASPGRNGLENRGIGSLSLKYHYPPDIEYQRQRTAMIWSHRGRANGPDDRGLCRLSGNNMSM